MKVVKITPAGTLVLQFPANVEIEAVKHEGMTYVPMFSVEEIDEPETKPEKKKEPIFPEDLPETSKKKSAPVEEEEEKPATKSPKGAIPTEDELTDMPTKDLLKLCEEMGIDPEATEGKNTNKKLRTLILNAKPAKEVEQDEDEVETPKKKSAPVEEERVDAVAEALEKFAAGGKKKTITVEVICEALGTDDDELVSALVTKFEKDEKLDIDEFAQVIIDEVTGGVKASKKEVKEEKLVKAEELEVGDKVSVWWNDGNQFWAEGEVISTRRGKVVVKYFEDGEEEVIDPEVHTKIRLL